MHINDHHFKLCKHEDHWSLLNDGKHLRYEVDTATTTTTPREQPLQTLENNPHKPWKTTLTNPRERPRAIPGGTKGAAAGCLGVDTDHCGPRPRRMRNPVGHNKLPPVSRQKDRIHSLRSDDCYFTFAPIRRGSISPRSLDDAGDRCARPDATAEDGQRGWEKKNGTGVVVTMRGTGQGTVPCMTG